MTNGGSSETSVSLVGPRAETPSSVLTKINKTFKWNFLAAIWHNNHQGTPESARQIKLKFSWIWIHGLKALILEKQPQRIGQFSTH